MFRWRWKALLAITVASALAAGGMSADAATGCRVRWGSLPEESSAGTTGTVEGVRVGRHACYDRLVVDISGPRAGYRVEYVRTVTEDGSGDAVPLRGGAFLQIVVRAAAYDDQHRPTYVPADRREVSSVRGFATFRQVADAGSFEGQTTFGLGVRARLPFRVFTLDGPGDGSRLVIDVAHRW